MNKVAIEFNNVWKKYKKGEKFNSLRDAVPNLVRGMFSSNKKDIDILAEREFWAVHGVSFNISPGEVVGVLGPNGAGKSTILKLLSGIIIPTKGTMKIHGRLSALIEVTAGFHPELTGRENVYLNGTILGMKKKEIDDRFDNIVDFSGINEFIDTPVKRYSSGMYSRLGFSVAAHMNPDILLVDEVLSVGDISFQAKCAQKMRELLNSGTTIVIVSHNLSLIENLCKRVILINKGTLLKEGSPEEVIPFYENIIFQKQEEDFKKKVDSYKVKVKEESDVIINKVYLKDGQGQVKANFDSSDSLKIEFDYEVQKPIEQPIFAFEITRADGVVCCSARSNDSGVFVKEINKASSASIDLGRINLAPGVYMLKIAIWDQDFIHPYVMRKEDVLRINVNEKNKGMQGVFIPQVNWKLA